MSDGNIMEIFSVYDSKAELYMQPFFASNREVARRMFSQAVEDEGHEFARHSEDYSLFLVGMFDMSKGLVSNDNERPEVVANAWELKAATNRLEVAG